MATRAICIIIALIDDGVIMFALMIIAASAIAAEPKSQTGGEGVFIERPSPSILAFTARMDQPVTKTTVYLACRAAANRARFSECVRTDGPSRLTTAEYAERVVAQSAPGYRDPHPIPFPITIRTWSYRVESRSVDQILPVTETLDPGDIPDLGPASGILKQAEILYDIAPDTGGYPPSAKRAGVSARVTMTCRIVEAEPLFCRDVVAVPTGDAAHFEARFMLPFQLAGLKAMEKVRVSKLTRAGAPTADHDLAVVINWAIN